MKRLVAPLALFLSVVLAISASNAEPRSSRPTGAKETSASANELDLRIGGVGGVYFLAEPGELTVTVEKRDRNRPNRKTELRAILVGPDRQVLDEATIPDDNAQTPRKLGPPRRVRLSTHVERKGVYGLNVTVSQDRYGDEVLWGFRTNCPRYLIETDRGHRDKRHEEPIVLGNPDAPGDVCFLPRRNAFGIEITGLPKNTGSLHVYDRRGALVESLQPEADGRASCAIPAGTHRDAVPWRLHLPVQQGTIQIDGVTRWERQDLYPDLPYWTPDPNSWFPLLEYRWLLTPYSRQAYGRPGEQGEVVFQVHNNSDQKKTVQLALEFPSDSWPVQLSTERVVLGPKKAQNVVARYTVPAEGQTSVCHLRATPVEDPEFSTYSTLTVKAGTAPASQPLAMPLLLKPYRHENEQFGYLPDYPTENQVYFDLKNRPWVRTADGVATCRDGKWTTIGLRTAVTSRTPSFDGSGFGMPSNKIAFDRDGDMYVLANTGRTISLLHSRDGGKTFSAYVLPGREGESRTFDFEQFSGQNTLDGPPPVLRYTQTARDAKLIWRVVNDLELFWPKKIDNRLVIGESVLVSKDAIGFSAHSGIPSGVVSRGSKAHVVWAEATDPAVKLPGVPTYVATYDRATGRLGKPALVGHGPPANDVHNTPSITIDGQGYLHVLVGTHGQPFPYARSLQPNDAQAGWTEPVPVGEKLSLTYIGLVCGPDDTLHLVARLFRFGEEPFPNSHHGTLAYLRKPSGKPWEAPRTLIVSPFSEYSVFYHRLTLDRTGRLFLSYDNWSTYWFYRMDYHGSRRALMMSPDGGATWKLAETSDLLRP
ncbi:MAG: BNR-4 repeat-containing protein [Thermoguttaceae bacterium]|jgi:hypothetical protein